MVGSCPRNLNVDTSIYPFIGKYSTSLVFAGGVKMPNNKLGGVVYPIL